MSTRQLCAALVLVFSVTLVCVLADPLLHMPSGNDEENALFNKFLDKHRPARVVDPHAARTSAHNITAPHRSPLTDPEAPYEHEYRKHVFLQRVAKIVAFNQKYWHPNDADAPFLAVNFLADLTEEEATAAYFGAKLPNLSGIATQEHVKTQAIPDTVDWRNNIVLTPMKNQGSCGSCWAFATTQAVEAASTLETGVTSILSPQQPLDCASGSCSGGYSDEAANVIYNAGGQCLESAYPYTSAKGTCAASSCAKAAQHAGWVQISSPSAANLESAVAQQPVVIYLKAGDTPFSSYGGGILPASTCTSNTIDHAITMIGYSVSSNYFIARNQWGDGWGEQGYIRMEPCACNSCSWSGYPKARGRCAANVCSYGQKCTGDTSAAGYSCSTPCAVAATEGDTATLSCGANRVIKSITFASYGTPTGSCGAYATSSCHASTSNSVVSNAFIGKSTASIVASNDVFGDPCVGTLKKLYIQAVCAPRVCVKMPEGGTATVTCPPNSVISQVSFASFGTSTGTCGAFTASSCASGTSLSVVQAACLGKNTCSVAASNTVFGDPCSGTHKWLTIEALCTA